MKNVIILLFTLFAFAQFSHANTELTPVAKELVFNAIADYVYAEAGDLVRAPQNISDFKYDQINAERVTVEGESFSEMDGKNISYYCEIEILGRGVIESSYDFTISACSIAL